MDPATAVPVYLTAVMVILALMSIVGGNITDEKKKKEGNNS
jgi:hypothetical protein